MATATRSTNYEFGCLSVCDAEGEVEVVSSPACSSGCQVSIPRCCITMAFVSSHAGLRDAHKYWCLQRQRNQALGKHGLRLMLPKDGDIPKACSSTCKPAAAPTAAAPRAVAAGTPPRAVSQPRPPACCSECRARLCTVCNCAAPRLVFAYSLLCACLLKAVLPLSRLV